MVRQFRILAETILTQFPPQHQPFHHGVEWIMQPRPISETDAYLPSGKLQGKVAIMIVASEERLPMHLLKKGHTSSLYM